MGSSKTRSVGMSLCLSQSQGILCHICLLILRPFNDRKDTFLVSSSLQFNWLILCLLLFSFKHILITRRLKSWFSIFWQKILAQWSNINFEMTLLQICPLSNKLPHSLHILDNYDFQYPSIMEVIPYGYCQARNPQFVVLKKSRETRSGHRDTTKPFLSNFI